MVEEKSSGRKPDYKSDGVAVWVFQDKNNKPYLSIKVVGHDYVKAFRNESKQEEPKVAEEKVADLV